MIDSSFEDQVDTAAETSGLRDESATLASNELEDKADLPMEGKSFVLMRFYRSAIPSAEMPITTKTRIEVGIDGA